MDGFNNSDNIRNSYESIENFSWINDEIKKIDKGKRLYKFATWLLNRNLTYKEFYILLLTLNKKNGKDIVEVKKKVANRIIEIYNFNIKNDK